MADFYKMNPSVGSDCSGLALGSHYCLSTKDLGVFAPDDGATSPSPTSPSPTSSRPPTGSGTPTPIQVCATFHSALTILTFSFRMVWYLGVLNSTLSSQMMAVGQLPTRIPSHSKTFTRGTRRLAKIAQPSSQITTSVSVEVQRHHQLHLTLRHDRLQPLLNA